VYSITNYNEYKKLIMSENFRYGEVFKNIESIVNVEKVMKVYPKKMFKPMDELTLYFFTEEKMFIISLRPFKVKSYSINDIKNLEIILESDYVDKLKIILDNQEEIVFSNVDDTVEAWHSEYYEIIKDVTKYLMK
jgi:hypothetical protein